MKTINRSLFFILILIVFVCQSQENKDLDDTSNEEEVIQNKVPELLEFKIHFEYQALSPHTFGEHFLSKGYNQNALGFGLYCNILNYKDFNLGLGYSSFRSSLTNASLAGNFNRASYRSYYIQFSYHFYKINNFEFAATLGYGTNSIIQRTKGTRKGRLVNTEFRTGIYTQYNYSNILSFSLGANYLTSGADISRSSQSGDLFGRTNVVYGYIGLITRFY